jgi:hypothetical protein
MEKLNEVRNDYKCTISNFQPEEAAMSVRAQYRREDKAAIMIRFEFILIEGATAPDANLISIRLVQSCLVCSKRFYYRMEQQAIEERQQLSFISRVRIR